MNECSTVADDAGIVLRIVIICIAGFRHVFVRVSVSTSLDGMSYVKPNRALQRTNVHIRTNQLKPDDYSRNMIILRMFK